MRPILPHRLKLEAHSIESTHEVLCARVSEVLVQADDHHPSTLLRCAFYWQLEKVGALPSTTGGSYRTKFALGRPAFQIRRTVDSDLLLAGVGHYHHPALLLGVPEDLWIAKLRQT